jgi:hypothetical protein
VKLRLGRTDELGDFRRDTACRRSLFLMPIVLGRLTVFAGTNWLSFENR